MHANMYTDTSTHACTICTHKCIIVKPPNSGHFRDSDYVCSREVVPFPESPLLEVSLYNIVLDTVHHGYIYYLRAASIYFINMHCV